MKVTSASFFIGEALLILARYQAPSENLADTRSPPLGTNPGGDEMGERWWIENSRMSVSRDAIPEYEVFRRLFMGFRCHAHLRY